MVGSAALEQACNGRGIEPIATNPELDRWNERFSSEDYLFGTAPNAFLVRQRHLLRPGASVLAIADGEGRNGVWLAEQGLDCLLYTSPSPRDS